MFDVLVISNYSRASVHYRDSIIRFLSYGFCVGTYFEAKIIWIFRLCKVTHIFGQICMQIKDSSITWKNYSSTILALHNLAKIPRTVKMPGGKYSWVIPKKCTPVITKKCTPVIPKKCTPVIPKKCTPVIPKKCTPVITKKCTSG